MRITTTTVLAAVATPLLIAAAASAGGNLLTNWSFEVVGPDGMQTSHTGYRGQGNSAAMGWGVFHNTEGTTTTELLATTAPSAQAGDFMLHVTTDGANNGLGNTFGSFNNGPACVMEGAWIYVVSGQVFIGAGNGGNTGPNSYTTTTGAWEWVTAHNTICPANQFIIYSTPGGAEFYVDMAQVWEDPCVAPPGDVNGDGTVDAADLAGLLDAWGPNPGHAADLTGDGIINPADLAYLLANWGCTA